MNSRDLRNFMCGAACGVAICALMLPKSGPQVREIVRTKAKGAADMIRQGEEAILQCTSDLQATVGRQRTGIMEAVEAGRGAYQRATAAVDAAARNA